MMRRRAWLVALGALAVGGLVWAADPVAYITEIHRAGPGEVRVKATGESDWRPAKPLMALAPGDQIRVQGAARVVVLFHQSGATQTITAASSPFTVPEVVPPAGGSNQLRVLASTAGRFLTGKQDPPVYRRLSVRSLSVPPVILSPRHTRVPPAGLVFEWEGGAGARYTVRVAGPAGVVWEQAGLPLGPLVYPATAPPLAPGVRYRWQLETPGHAVEETQFELLADGEWALIRERLTALDREGGLPPGTRAVIRTAVLVEAGLHAEARRELLAAIRSAPEDPTPRLLLGHLYQRVGLTAKAADLFDQAQEPAR
jgi:hypothetical protein